MEEGVAERLTSQEPQINQQQTWHNGSVGPSDTKCPEDPSHNWYARSQTCWSRSHVPSGSSERNILSQDKGHTSVCRDFNRGQCSRGRLCKYQHCLLGEHGRSTFNMCRDFIRGNCTYGESCKYLHSKSDKHDGNGSYGNENLGNFANFGKPRFGEVNKDGNLKSFLPREHRSTAPCWNFPNGRCNNGTNCRYLHIESTAYVRPRDDETSHNQEVAEHLVYPMFNKGHVDVSLRTSQENNEVNKDLRNHSIHRESRSRSPCRKFRHGSCLRGSSCPYMHPNMHDKPKFDYSTQHHQGLTHVKGAMGLTSRRTHGEFGNDKQIKEFCLKFAKGRCDRGDSCRYLHSFHEYAKSIPEANKEQHSNNIGGSSDGARYHVGNGSCLSEKMDTVNGSVSQDGVLDEQSKRLSVDDSFNPNVMDQKEEAGGDISLWSQPFKRRRSWSESPFTPRDDFSSRFARRDGFQNSFMRDRNYNLVPFQYHHRGSYHHNWSRCNLDNRPHPNGTTSMDLPSCQVNKDSNIEIPNQNSEYELAKSDLPSGDSHLTKTQVMCNGIHQYQCGAGSLDSNNSILHQVIHISNGQIGPSPKEIEFESTSPSEYDTSLRNNDGEVSINPIMETSGLLIKGSNSKFKGKLLILDVNGILADIVADYPEEFKPDTVVSMKGVFKRPFCDDFLDFCFERFDVGVWSSRNQKNVDKVTDFLIGDSKKKLLFCWDQSYCTDTGYNTVENRAKPLVLKELRRLWEKQVDDLPWEEGYYNETNTILLDDSPYKALRNPPYTAVFPFPFTFKDSRDTDLGPNGKLRLYLEALSKAENVQKFIQENPFGQRPITKSNLSWCFYSKIVDDH